MVWGRGLAPCIPPLSEALPPCWGKQPVSTYSKIFSLALFQMFHNLGGGWGTSQLSVCKNGDFFFPPGSSSTLLLGCRMRQPEFLCGPDQREFLLEPCEWSKERPGGSHDIQRQFSVFPCSVLAARLFIIRRNDLHGDN